MRRLGVGPRGGFTTPSGYGCGFGRAKDECLPVSDRPRELEFRFEQAAHAGMDDLAVVGQQDMHFLHKRPARGGASAGRSIPKRKERMTWDCNPSRTCQSPRRRAWFAHFSFGLANGTYRRLSRRQLSVSVRCRPTATLHPAIVAKSLGHIARSLPAPLMGRIGQL